MLPNYGRSFAPAGKTPVIPLPATRFALAMIASLTNRGKLRFMIIRGACDTAIFLTFLRRLIRDAPCEVFLIPAFARIDTLKVHHARAVTRWVRKHRDRLELFYLLSAVLRLRAQPGGISQPDRDVARFARPGADRDAHLLFPAALGRKRAVMDGFPQDEPGYLAGIQGQAVVAAISAGRSDLFLARPAGAGSRLDDALARVELSS
jgi:hypothetical protein